ncbi:Coiled-coil domain containing protein 32 [Trinorchestia longiramus]|nr:Coiled-coil domain containing protein 32 [Trinorchestia longiramus]
MVSDPWGSLSSRSQAQERNPELQFEDNFSTECTGLNDKKYVALDDSSSYLDRLQKKLDKVQGNAEAPSSRSLLAGLKSARQCHHHHFLSTTRPENNIPSQEERPSADDSTPLAADLPHARGLILSERQRHVDNLLVKLAPDRVALSNDELVYLLSADLLDSVQIIQESSDNTGAAARATPNRDNSDEVITNAENNLNSTENEADTNDETALVPVHFEVNFETASYEEENM